jgi:hypothetical protein
MAPARRRSMFAGKYSTGTAAVGCSATRRGEEDTRILFSPGHVVAGRIATTQPEPRMSINLTSTRTSGWSAASIVIRGDSSSWAREQAQGLPLTIYYDWDVVDGIAVQTAQIPPNTHPDNDTGVWGHRR